MANTNKLNTEKVVSALRSAGLVALKSDRDYTRPGFSVRKINTRTVGILFDSIADGRAASATAQVALTTAGLTFQVMEDTQTLVVRTSL